jgi:hypothetical protein
MASQGVFGQEKERKWTIQTNPLLLFSDFFVSDVEETLFIMDLEGQYKLSKSSNISLTLSFLYNDHISEDYSNGYYYHNETSYQIGFRPMYIHRPFETGLGGFYLGVYPNLGIRYNVREYATELYTELGFGLTLGYKWIFNSGFTMQLGSGFGKTFTIPRRKESYDSFINSDGRITVIRSDIYLFDFKLGYSF